MTVHVSARKRHRSLIEDTFRLGFFSVLFFLSIRIVNALKPTSVYGMAYTTVNERFFIIQGGAEYHNDTFSTYTNQFMALDLARLSWAATSPPWVPINIIFPLPQSLTTSHHSMTASPDGRYLTVWDLLSVISYSLDTETWTSLGVPLRLTESERELKAATNPNTGITYIPLGSQGTNMLVYDPVCPIRGEEGPNSAEHWEDSVGDGDILTVRNVRVRSAMMPLGIGMGSTGYTWLWSSVRQSFVLFGGRVGSRSSNGPYIHEYQPNRDQWRVLKTTGAIPPRLIGSCMVSAHNGTKLILFGGHSANSVSTGSLYILDVHTMTWARGPNVHSAQYRSHLACTVTRDNFIAFGGIRRVDAIASTRLDATPLIYNLRKNRWVQHFTQVSHETRPLAPTSPVTPTPPVSIPPPKRNYRRIIVNIVIGGFTGYATGVTANYIVRKRRILFRYLTRWGREPSSSNPIPVYGPSPQPIDVVTVDDHNSNNEYTIDDSYSNNENKDDDENNDENKTVLRRYLLDSQATLSPLPPAKPNDSTHFYMNRIKRAVRQQNNGEGVSTLMWRNNNNSANQQPDTERHPSATVTKPPERVLSVSTSTLTSRSFAASTATSTSAVVRRLLLGGHEASTTGSRQPQNPIGVGTSKALFGDEDMI